MKIYQLIIIGDIINNFMNEFATWLPVSKRNLLFVTKSTASDSERTLFVMTLYKATIFFIYFITFYNKIQIFVSFQPAYFFFSTKSILNYLEQFFPYDTSLMTMNYLFYKQFHKKIYNLTWKGLHLSENFVQRQHFFFN